MSNPKNLSIIQSSVTGKRHQHNEDEIIYLSNDDYMLLCVLDGVGSAKHNKAATEIASNYIIKNHEKYYQKNNSYYALSDLVFDINEQLLSSGLKQMHSTCSIFVYLTNIDLAYYLNIGDSRIYKIGNTYKKPLTKDDTLFKNSNVITKCFGMPLKRADLRQKVLKKIDYNILVCSDGFHKILDHNIKIYEALIDENANTSKINWHLQGKNNDDASYILLKQS